MRLQALTLIFCNIGFSIALNDVNAEDKLLTRSLVVTSPEPPFVEIPGVQSSYNALVAMSTLSLMASVLRLDLNITHPPDFRFGGLTNGKWDGIVGQLLRKEADLGGSLNAITYARFEAVDFTVPVLFDVTGILIPFPEETTKIVAVLKPFSFEVWSAFITSLMLLWIIMVVEGHIKGSKRTAGEHLMWLTSIITGQGAAWCLTNIVFIYVYTGVLMGELAVPSYTPVVNSLDDLASDRFIKPVTIKSTAVDDMMLNAKSGTYKLIGEVFRKNPNETLVANTEIGVQKAASGFYGFLEPRMSLLSLMENDHERHNRCRVTLAKETFYPRSFAYLLPKKSSIKATFDRQILLLQQYGFIHHFQKQISMKRKDLCLLKNKQIKIVRKMTLDRVSSAFLLLLSGYVLSFSSFLFSKIRLHTCL